MNAQCGCTFISHANIGINHTLCVHPPSNRSDNNLTRLANTTKANGKVLPTAGRDIPAEFSVLAVKA